MFFSWSEILEHLQDKIEREDCQNLTPMIENIHLLNNAYYEKESYDHEVIKTHLDFLETLALKQTITEPIITSMQAIDSHISNSTSQKPLMNQQKFLMDKMKAAGYKITGLGECYGLSNLMIQAFFANDIITFNQRLQTIYDLPIESFENNFSTLKQEREALKENRNFVDANKINDTIVDLHAFFDGVALNQRPDFYLPDENNQPISKKQCAKKTLPITQSLALDEQGQQTEIITSFTGAYSKDNLDTYLSLMKETLGNNPFALNLICHMHAISLTYEPSNDNWIFFDPSHLPANDYSQTTHLANAVFTHFEKIVGTQSHIIMGTQITTKALHKAQCNKQLNVLQNNNAWVEINSQARLSKDAFGFDCQTLYDELYSEQINEDNWTDKKILHMAIKNEQNDVIIDYVTTNGLDVFLDMELMDLSACLLIFPSAEQQQLLNKLSIECKAEMIESNYIQFIPKIFHLLSEDEKLPIYHKLSQGSKYKYLKQLSTHQLTTIFSELSIQKKSKVSFSP